MEKMRIKGQDAFIHFTCYASDLFGDICELIKAFPVSCIFTTQHECDDLMEITYFPKGGQVQQLFPALSALPIYRNDDGVEQFIDFDIFVELEKRGLSDAQLSLIFNGRTRQDLLDAKEAIIEEHHLQDLQNEMQPVVISTGIDDEIPF